MPPLEALGKNPFLFSSSQHPLVCDHIILIFKAVIFKLFCYVLSYLSVCVCKISLCFPFMRMHDIAFRAHLNNPQCSHICKALFSKYGNMYGFQGLGFRLSIFWGEVLVVLLCCFFQLPTQMEGETDKSASRTLPAFRFCNSKSMAFGNLLSPLSPLVFLQSELNTGMQANKIVLKIK